MKFLIVSHVIHKKNKDNYYGYAPYIKEMNLWLKYVDHVQIIAPLDDDELNPIDISYEHPSINFVKVPAIEFTSVFKIIKSCLVLPIIFYHLIKGMYWANHIHLRCPGNMGLLGTIVQMLFPKTKKTAKYAGNWDPKSPQPLTYRWQRDLLGNTSLTKNIKTLVYGEWDNLNQNHLSFFTATYWNKDKEAIATKILDKQKEISFLFVGSLVKGKQPLLSVQVIKQLKEKGLKPILNVCGEGAERESIENYIKEHQLEKEVILHGNVDGATVKKMYQKSQFLLFISKSEGWPKVVAESMFWGCLPITTEVSCVSWMLDKGGRGELVKPNVQEILKKINFLIDNEQIYQEKVKFAEEWSQQYTLDKFELEIKKLI